MWKITAYQGVSDPQKLTPSVSMPVLCHTVNPEHPWDVWVAKTLGHRMTSAGCECTVPVALPLANRRARSSPVTMASVCRDE